MGVSAVIVALVILFIVVKSPRWLDGVFFAVLSLVTALSIARALLA